MATTHLPPLVELPPARPRMERPRTHRGRLHGTRRASPSTAALLTVLLPGAGHLYTGRWHRGLALVTLTVGLVALAAAAAMQGAAQVASLLVRPPVLAALLAVDVTLLAFRAAVTVDAWRFAATPATSPLPARRRARRRWPLVASSSALALALILTAVPHVAVAYYDLQLRDVLTDVFPSVPSAGPLRHLAGQIEANRPTSPLLRRERITVLLLGGDAGPLRFGMRTDSIVVVSVEPATHRTALFSVPRNLVQVPLPDWVRSPWECRCFPDPINALYAWSLEHPELLPPGTEPGPAVVAGAIERLLGLPIDYYVLTDLKGFVEAVDTLGGVDVTVSQHLNDQLDSPDGEGQWDAIDLPPGRHHLDGRQALVYVRTRRDSDDYARIGRQRCLLAAMAQHADAPTLLKVFPKLADVARHSLTTNLPLEALPDLIRLAPRIDAGHVTSVVFTEEGYSGEEDDNGYPIPALPLIRRTVRATLTGARLPAPTADAPLESSTGGDAATAQDAGAPEETGGATSSQDASGRSEDPDRDPSYPTAAPAPVATACG